MEPELMAAVIGGLCGAAFGGLVSYLVWYFKQPGERKEALIHEKMKQRWDASQVLLHLLSELDHGLDHIRTGDIQPYLELGRKYRTDIREESRKYRPLLGDRVTGLVHELTELYETLYVDVENGKQPPEQLFTNIRVREGRTREAIEAELQSPVTA